MGYARGNKHYRAAQEQAASSHEKGYFFPESHKKYALWSIIIFSMLVFLKGFIFGYIFSNKR